MAVTDMEPLAALVSGAALAAVLAAALAAASAAVVATPSAHRTRNPCRQDRSAWTRY